MTKIKLIQNKGFQWFTNEFVYVKGCFFDNDNHFYERENLLDFFSNIKTTEDFLSKIKTADGIFTVIIKRQKQIMIASDTSRIFPLFYSFRNDGLFISDDIDFLKNTLNINNLNADSEKEFSAAAHTFGNKTLLRNIYQSQSNEYLIFGEDKLIKQGFFFSYSTIKLNTSSYSEITKQAVNTFEKAFNRLISSLNNKPVALPLSGGYDSRLIAVMLKKHNYENVICFTFGKKNNFETENSKKTAKILGFKWVFIEYSSILINNYLETEIFKEYVHFAGKYSSMPFLQEYFAVKYLKEQKIIADNTVFIPGHSGDLLGGSQLIKVVSKNLKSSDIPKQIVKKKLIFNSVSGSDKQKMKNTIETVLYSFNPDYQQNIPYSVFEDFDIKEKLTKFIFNSTSVFNFFGYEQRFPYWDKELLLFFRDVPYKYKKMKRLYDEILTNYYFKPFNVNFEKEIQSSFIALYVQKIKNHIKPYLPGFIRKKFMEKNDWKNYEEITKQLIISAKKNKQNLSSKINKYNELIIRWYLLYVKGLLK